MSEKGKTPLYQAASEGHLKCVQLLLRANAHPLGNPKAYGTPFHISLAMGHIDCANELFRFVSDPNLFSKEGGTPAHGATFYGRLKSLEFLYEKGANFNLPDHRTGIRVVDVAAARNDLPILNFLTTKGIIQAKHKEGNL